LIRLLAHDMPRSSAPVYLQIVRELSGVKKQVHGP